MDLFADRFSRWASTEGVDLIKQTIQCCEEEGNMKLFIVAGYMKNGDLISVM